MEILTTIIGLLISALFVYVIRPWLESKKFSFLETLKLSANDALKIIVNNLLEKRYPEIAKKVVDNVLVGEDAVKAELKKLGDEALTLLFETFRHRGFDLEGLFGKTFWQELLRNIVDEVSLFPGKSTAKQLSDKDVSTTITEKGLYAPEITAATRR